MCRTHRATKTRTGGAVLPLAPHPCWGKLSPSHHLLLLPLTAHPQLLSVGEGEMASVTPMGQGLQEGGGECLSLSGVRARALANDPFSLGHWTPSSVPALRPPSCCQAGLQKMSGARGTSSTPRSHCLFHHHCPHPATPPLPIAFCPTPLSCEAGREKA